MIDMIQEMCARFMERAVNALRQTVFLSRPIMDVIRHMLLLVGRRTQFMSFRLCVMMSCLLIVLFVLFVNLCSS